MTDKDQTIATGPRAQECHEGVTRKGEFQPCEKPAVAMRHDPEGGSAYPVCKRHTRGDVLPITFTQYHDRADAEYFRRKWADSEAELARVRGELDAETSDADAWHDAYERVLRKLYEARGQVARVREFAEQCRDVDIVSILTSTPAQERRRARIEQTRTIGYTLIGMLDNPPALAARPVTPEAPSGATCACGQQWCTAIHEARCECGAEMTELTVRCRQCGRPNPTPAPVAPVAADERADAIEAMCDRLAGRHVDLQDAVMWALSETIAWRDKMPRSRENGTYANGRQDGVDAAVRIVRAAVSAHLRGEPTPTPSEAPKEGGE